MPYYIQLRLTATLRYTATNRGEYTVALGHICQLYTGYVRRCVIARKP